jgi:hypothetical protein
MYCHTVWREQRRTVRFHVRQCMKAADDIASRAEAFALRLEAA